MAQLRGEALEVVDLAARVMLIQNILIYYINIIFIDYIILINTANI